MDNNGSLSFHRAHTLAHPAPVAPAFIYNGSLVSLYGMEDNRIIGTGLIAQQAQLIPPPCDTSGLVQDSRTHLCMLAFAQGEVSYRTRGTYSPTEIALLFASSKPHDMDWRPPV